MVRVMIEKIVTKLVTGFQNFGEASVAFDVGFNGKIKKFKGAINSLIGTGFVSFCCPFEGAGDLTADVAHLIGNGAGEPVFVGFFAMDIVYFSHFWTTFLILAWVSGFSTPRVRLPCEGRRLTMESNSTRSSILSLSR